MDAPTATLRIRNVARVIVVNNADEILLVKHSDKAAINPDQPDVLTYWVPPGGGLEEGETFEQAAIRELREETGVEISEVEKCILTREVDLFYGKEFLTQHEQFFLARISGKQSLSNFTPNDAEVIVDARWWRIAEIKNSNESFFPSDIAELMKKGLDRS
jgi:8-oxo-dGTP pyrophosphatase MutT (NUDIX family)